MNMDKIIEIKDLTFKYKGSKEAVLSHFNLSIDRGEVLLLCGESGSGKTTIIKLINGLIPHYYQGEYDGDVLVDGKRIQDTQLYDLAGTVGSVFQNPRSQFFSIDTDGEIVFGPENIGLDPEEINRRKDKAVVDMCVEKLLGRSLFELSGGQKQKVACASVSALLPEIILLDEPSSNLDRQSILDLRESIMKWKEEGKTIIVSEHRLWYLKDLVDRVLYIEKGLIKQEWTAKTFFSFDEETIKKLRLRTICIDNKTNAPLLNNIQKEKERDWIHLKRFVFSYHRKKWFKKREEKQILNIPSLSFPKGSVIGILGENGAGKSTFLRCLCGLEKQCPGTITMDGKEYKGKDRLKLSYLVMQDVNHQLFTDSVKDEVLLSMEKEDLNRCDQILESLGLLEFKDKHPMALSGGQKQRVAIASAMAAEADILLFDEPTSGLDYDHMVKVSSLFTELAKKGKTVLVSTHDPEVVNLCCQYVFPIE